MFKKGNQIVLLSFFALLLIAILVIVYHHLKSSYCDYESITEIASPDKSHTLVIYKESCSIFNSSSIKGTILTLDEILKFHYDDIFKIDPKSLKLDPGGEQSSIGAVWESPADLSIYIDKNVEVRDKHTSYKGINIKYLNK